MKKLNILFALIACLITTSCHKEIVDISDLDFGVDTEGNNEIDQWLKENYLNPYNIEVMYKWKASELSTPNTLVPPEEKHIIPVMDMIKKGWIDVYNAMGDPDFIKKHSPKQYLLIGSAEYNSSGGLTTGTAEGGTKIVIFRINWFDMENQPLLKRIMKTVHHEYVHILNQKKQIPDSFELISQANYTSSFGTLTDAQARELGFLTPYSASSPGEDFAEVVSVILTEGKEGYESILASIANPQAVADIKAKEAAVVDYYKTYWNIDFYELLSKSEEAIHTFSPVDLNQYMGKEFEDIYLDINDETLWGQNAVQAANNTKTAFKNQIARNLDYASLYFNAANPSLVELRFRFALTDFTQRATGSVYLKADFDRAANRIKFSQPTASGSNATFVWNGLTPLLDYLTSNTFKIKFKNGYNKDSEGEIFGGLVNTVNEDDFIYGTLTKPGLNRSFGYGHKNLNLHIFDESYWFGDALTAIRETKSLALTADARKLDYLRFVLNLDGTPSTTLYLKFSTTSLTASATAAKTYTVNYDRETNRLIFANPTPTGSNANIVKNALDRFDEYLTSRTFKVEYQTTSSYDNMGDNYAKISNIDDEADYFVCQLNSLPLQLEIGRSIHYFNFQNRESGYYFGDALTALNQMKSNLITLHSHTFSHYQLKLDIEANLASLSFYSRNANNTLVGSTITMSISYNRAQNQITFGSPSYTNAQAQAIQTGITPFINFFTSRAFRFAYRSGSTYYTLSGASGQLIDVNNANNYIVLPL